MNDELNTNDLNFIVLRSYFIVPLLLAALSFVGTLVFVRFLGDRWL